MSAIFEITIASLSVAGLFTSCVQCFEYVQLGRNLGDDYERYQLKLDVARLRLTRWGEGVGIYHNDRFNAIQPTYSDHEVRLAKGHLQDIFESFDKVHYLAKKYEKNSRPNDLALCSPEDLSTTGRELRQHLTNSFRRRQMKDGFLQKASWALYDKKHLDSVVGDIVSMTGNLEIIFPSTAPTAMIPLAQAELQGLDNEPALRLLRNCAADGNMDEILRKAIDQHGELYLGRTWTKNVNTHEDARAQIGLIISDEALSKGLRINDAGTWAEDVTTDKGGRVHIGAQVGGQVKGVFDD